MSKSNSDYNKPTTQYNTSSQNRIEVRRKINRQTEIVLFYA